jgi:hypothetical protein
MIARSASGVALVLDGRHEGVRPFVSIDVQVDGAAEASPAFVSAAEMRAWQDSHPAPWGCERRVLDGKQARRWLAAEARA